MEFSYTVFSVQLGNKGEKMLLKPRYERHFAEWKKPVSKSYRWYGFNYVIFSKRQTLQWQKIDEWSPGVQDGGRVCPQRDNSIREYLRWLNCVASWLIAVHKSIHILKFMGLYIKNQSILPYYYLKIKLLKGKKNNHFLSHQQQNAGLVLWNVTAGSVNKLYTTLS